MRSVTTVTPESSVVRSNFKARSDLTVLAERSRRTLPARPPAPVAPVAAVAAVPPPSVAAPVSRARPSLAGERGRPRFLDRLAGRHLAVEPGGGSQVDPTLRVDAGDLDLERVSDLDGVFDPFDPALSELRDVHEPVPVGGDVHKGAEACRRDDLAGD